jgi:chemotaxis protein CheX
MGIETEVNVFVNGVLHYFDTMVQQVAECGTPFLALGSMPEVSDYTGVIRISGKREGVVYFTASRNMLSVMLMRMQETDMGHENLCDLVGEIANTLSGNARRDFGHQFQISVPAVLHGRNAAMEHPADTRPIVIPILWRTHRARLVVCLNN